MKTFGEVTVEVLRFGFNDGPQVNKARIEDYVNEAQLQIARQVEAPEFQESKELQLVSGKSKYDISSYSLLRVQDIYYPEMLQRLRPLDLQSFDAYGGTESPPDRYTLWKN